MRRGRAIGVAAAWAIALALGASAPAADVGVENLRVGFTGLKPSTVEMGKAFDRVMGEARAE